MIDERPNYAEGSSIEVWELNCRQSLMWAEQAREDAIKLERRQRLVARLGAVLAIVLLITVVLVIAVAANQ